MSYGRGYADTGVGRGAQKEERIGRFAARPKTSSGELQETLASKKI